MKGSYSRREFVGAACRAGAGLAASLNALRRGQARPRPVPAKYQPSWDSLKQVQVPPWYLDAKFGIFIHWGVYAVPAYGSEWYPRNMYLKGHDVYKYHLEHYGSPSQFGYKDFVPKLSAEKWSPDGWVELFRKSGAKYVVPVGEHHDGFPMYDCSFTRWNAVKMGPRRDIVGELGRSVRRQGLKFGISSHRAFNWSYYTFDKDFDTSDPTYSGLYGKPHAPTPLISNKPGERRQTAPKEFLDDWYGRSTEIVDKYRPDLMWFDFCFEGPEFEPYRQRFAAYYYNQAEDWGRGVAINYKHEAYPDDVAVLDIERGLLSDLRKQFWQTDTSVGQKSWGYIQDESFKSVDELVDELVDIVSKNGCLLLNIGPKADGTIPDEAQNILLGIGRWLDLNGEAIYATRPWKIYGEGPTKPEAGYFGERNKQTSYTAQDIRFTTKSGALYAIALDWPGPELKIKSLGSNSFSEKKISRVSLLGVNEKLEWKQTGDSLTIKTPGARPGDNAYAFKISFRT